jgi:alpha-amylase/alpha-mannosidase (GH57 family)
MAKLSFLWHLHQPSYRTADGVSHAPWVAIHAGGAYRTLASAIAEAGGRGQVVNIVPTLLEQLIAYRDGTVHDPVIDALITPAADLTNDQRELLVSWAFHVTSRQLKRYPRLAELARRRQVSNDTSRRSAAFGPGDLRDLQVLFLLAQAGEQAWRDERLRDLVERGRGFSPADHKAATSWLEAQPGELIELWQRVAKLPGVEISTSPYAHPIMPLLVDTGIVVESWAPHQAPEVPSFSHPEDAIWQLEQGLALMRSEGLSAQGCWPPEGSVSAEALAIYADADVKWLVTDEGILERSLGRPLRDENSTIGELYRPWTLTGPSPVLFFRDRTLSDAIGFRYGRWDDEARAARSLVDDLVNLSRTLPDEATIVLALDGENPWLHYPDGGGGFLRELMGALSQSGDDLQPETLTGIAESSQPDTLDKLHPGSWINGVFATWIGHPEKTAAWRLLAEVRDAIEQSGTPRPPSLLLAEASDWFWWLGDDNPTELAPLYDEIFRRHLADACNQADILPPRGIDTPLKTISKPVTVPVSNQWLPPRLDGRITSYFEWCLATQIEIEGGHPIRRLSVWAGEDRLHLLIEGERAMDETVTDGILTIHFEPENGPSTAVVIDRNGCQDRGVDCAVGRVAELSLPWDSHRTARLDVRCGERGALGGAILLLEPMIVDEEPISDDKE